MQLAILFTGNIIMEILCVHTHKYTRAGSFVYTFRYLLSQCIALHRLGWKKEKKKKKEQRPHRMCSSVKCGSKMAHHGRHLHGPLPAPKQSAKLVSSIKRREEKEKNKTQNKKNMKLYAIGVYR